jgi:hypothetical protein
MKVNKFNHWFKYKVPIDNHWSIIEKKILKEYKPGRLWPWLNEEYDVGQYYNWHEGRNYLVFHNKNHYLMFLLKL